MKGITRTILLSVFIALTSNCALQAWPSWQSVKNTAAKYKDNVLGTVGTIGSAYIMKQCWNTIKNLPAYLHTLTAIETLQNNIVQAYQANELSLEDAKAYIEYSNLAAKHFITQNNYFRSKFALASLGLALGACCLLPSLKVMCFGKPAEETD